MTKEYIKREMTKEDIKRAIDEYKGMYKNEYGGKLYRFRKNGENKIGYVKYETPNYFVDARQNRRFNNIKATKETERRTKNEH